MTAPRIQMTKQAYAERDLRVFELIDAGRSNAQIAEILGMSAETVRRKRRARERKQQT